MSKRNKHINTMIEDTPLLISDAKLDEILTFWDAYQSGSNIPYEPYEPPQPDIKDGIATIYLHGVISQRLNLIQKMSGGVSTEILQSQIEDAITNPLVKEVIIDIDSPGGSVDGISAISEYIYNARGIKPITAFVNPTALSAAYWIASATDRIVLSSPTAIVGSIGVVAVHKDISKAEDKAGVKTTEIVAGKYKRIASQYMPLSDEGLSEIQNQVNYIYQIFVDAVVKYRGVSKDYAIKNMADGKVYIGQQAIDVRLADEIKTVKKQNKGGVYMIAESQDIESIKADAYEQGIQQERSRILAILDIEIEGYETQVRDAIMNGWTAEQTALEILKVQKERGITVAQVRDGGIMAQYVGETENKETNPLIEDIRRRFK